MDTFYNQLVISYYTYMIFIDNDTTGAHFSYRLLSFTTSQICTRNYIQIIIRFYYLFFIDTFPRSLENLNRKTYETDLYSIQQDEYQVIMVRVVDMISKDLWIIWRFPPAYSRIEVRRECKCFWCDFYCLQPALF